MRHRSRRITLHLLLLLGLASPAIAVRAQTNSDSAQATPSARRNRTVPVAPASWVNQLTFGASVFTLDSTEIMASSGESFSAVLAARAPNLSVLRSGGSAAEGSRVRLRGPRSFMMITEPIVIVDGMRVDAIQETSLIDVGVRVSALDDIAPDDIARVDVLPGPAAASLFGPGAAGGALLITTKRGHAGPLRWGGRVESRLGMKRNDFPPNYRMNGVTPSGQPAASCNRLDVVAGICIPTQLDVWNPLEQASPFRSARTASGSMSLAGGNPRTSARLGVTGQRTLGVTGDDDDGRLGLRANVSHRATDAIDLGFHGGYMRRSSGLPLSGNNSGSIIAAGLFGSAIDDATRGYRVSPTQASTRQRSTHWLAGASAEWRVKSWLTATALYGRDDVDQKEDLRGTFQSSGTTLPVFEFTHSGARNHTTTTMSASLVATYATLRGLPISGRTTIGYERLRSAHEARDSQPSLERFVGHEWRLGGPWIRQQLAWRERLFVGAGLRLERREAYGANAPETWFKSADASWMLGDRGWLRGSRLRAAYGEGGSWMAGAPGLFAAPVPVPSDPSTPLQPERTAEMEIGADARLADRLALAVTAFRVNASDLYLFGVAPPSGGGTVFIVSPVGAMRNEGIEVVASANLVDRARLRWDATLTAATLRNRVTSLGSFPPIIGVGTTTQVGYPLGGYWSTPYTYADANRDGLIGSNEIQVSNSLTYAGSSLPTREASLRSSLSLPGGLKASALLDYRGGHKLENSNERVRCRIYANCRGAQDPASSLEEQAQFAAVRGSGSVDPYLEDASFVKLRELSLTWAIPASWTRYVGGGGAALTLAGRNLATWTSYEGLDPELTFTRFDDLPRFELSKVPIVREVVLRLDIGSGARP